MTDTPAPDEQPTSRVADLTPGDRIIVNGRPATVIAPPVRIVTTGRGGNAQAVIEYDEPEHWLHYDTISGTDDTRYPIAGDPFNPALHNNVNVYPELAVALDRRADKRKP